MKNVTKTALLVAALGLAPAFADTAGTDTSTATTTTETETDRDGMDWGWLGLLGLAGLAGLRRKEPVVHSNTTTNTHR
ncbi:WGxxGxxG family protein [Deinococcus deserti]|uniref:MYXO-CTERM domain-containing protein n=1 Tax=Deinococcus deserti (strain DSM 17065 / CIP 109153 / LMG 22923 / VCD115) TaxID=546414 RepID=X5HLL6_DEIDV|nr:WGxxGxxG family protein [Deinococcus deserti]AHX26561.1 conserved hypothetical protein, precursor [Deinococcus deserti VCD115]